MIDLFDFPRISTCDIKYFYAADGVWQMWQKPRGATICFMLCLGGGGGAGAGGNVAGSAYGGGGGSSSALLKVIVPAVLIPDNLYIRVGMGGIGSPEPGVAGGDGGLSYVSILPDTSAGNLLLVSGSAAAIGAASVSRTGGAAGIAATIASAPLLALGCAATHDGVDGEAGGSSITPQAGNGYSALVATIVTPGTGGGSGDRAGGAMTGNGLFRTVSGISDGANGPPGYFMNVPFAGIGGIGGGGGGGVTNGGAGGIGGFGCGGGGGGAGSGLLAGAGGNGGNGLVVIVTW